MSYELEAAISSSGTTLFATTRPSWCIPETPTLWS